MDSCDATRAVFTRVQSIEPNHAHKIIGFILLQDQAEKEMIRLAFGPESHIKSVISQAKSHLRLSPVDETVPSHRRSSSVNDICLFFSRGFCKNGGACEFSHGEEFGEAPKIEAFELYRKEVLRNKAAQELRFAEEQFLAGLRSEEFSKMNRFRMSRNDVCENGYGESGSVARQIYLTFPAESTFKEEDVSNYFSIFGPVQDVRIPYQQKRMFGFVTFVYPETVRVILAKGNPHFVCDSRVLVKPYKEKGKLCDKKLQFDRSEYSLCSSPTGMDYREPFEMHVGPRLLNNNREILRKKLEHEAAWQQALELQRRRLMNMQLADLKIHNYEQNPLAGSPSHASITQNMLHQSYNFIHENAPEVFAENQGSPTGVCIRELSPVESLEHTLPDGLLASPTKSTAENRPILPTKPIEVDNSVTLSTPPTNNDTLSPSPKSHSFLRNPLSISPGNGSIGM